MHPPLTGIDHVHVYVADRDRAQEWYADILGFVPVDAYRFWADDGGPLTLQDADGCIHLALFERPGAGGNTALALGTTADGFLAWQAHLEGRGIKVRVSDHTKAWSMYFADPDDNLHEITTYDHEAVAAELSSG